MASRSYEHTKVQQEIKKIQRKCVRCGSKIELEGHHLIHFENNGPAVIENMVTLCHACHMKQHHGNDSIDIISF